MLCESSTVNADSLLAACDVLELYNTVDKSEEGVIGSDTDIVAGMNCGSSLSYYEIHDPLSMVRTVSPITACSAYPVMRKADQLITFSSFSRFSATAFLFEAMVEA